MKLGLWTVCLATILVLSVTGCPHKEPHLEEHGEENHDEHGEESHDEHSEGGHDEHGEGAVVNLSPEAMSKIEIETESVAKREIPLLIHTTARVDYDQRRIAHVGPRIPGRVHKVTKTLGDIVKAGDALATLDSVVLGEAIARHRAAAVEEELARKTLEREGTLVKEKLSSEQQFIEAEAQHQKAVAAKRAAAERLRLYGGRGVSGSYFKLRAPIDGKIVKMHLTLGELVTPEDVVYTVADLSGLWIWVDIFERDLSRVHVDDDVVILTEAYGDEPFIGKVAYIMDEVDADSRTLRARIDIDNTNGKLKPGMFASVTLSDPHAKGGTGAGKQVVAASPNAILREGDEWIAFVKVGERRFERREVETGVRTSEFVEVIAGLAEGDEVVVKGGFLLKSEVAKGSMGGGHSH